MDEKQPLLFEDERPERMGQASVEYRDVSQILTPASGFMRDYDYTLNPYSGCAFGCQYCYAAFFARKQELRDQWGYWVQVKQNAVDLLRPRKSLSGKSIYMSSVTDPYQPIERKLELVRELLTVLVQHQPRLVIQTRSPLVTRDSDLFQQFDTIQVNMTVTTDSDEIRKAFEPQCPSNKQRIDAASELVKAGIDTVITMTPLLPIKSAEQFAARLLKSGVQRFVVQPFHPERGKFVRGTRDEALNLIKSFDWDQAHYERAVAVLMRKLPMLNEGQTGFAPPV